MKMWRIIRERWTLDSSPVFDVHRWTNAERKLGEFAANDIFDLCDEIERLEALNLAWTGLHALQSALPSRENDDTEIMLLRARVEQLERENYQMRVAARHSITSASFGEWEGDA